ncbi:hypothetical protein [Bradyrhizobium sp. RP6]|uniref:hypothetical protein n=1 Tax=Bradyrhizobium sp. RP6 TaxID=2489596 RepID=UPI000F52ED37|nr:hypothetical protein [Bradyrhizobium sp. RP6]RQH06878.1 hypothetical protein EHH60_30195 [Bradyrhizobium sp. RP6]
MALLYLVPSGVQTQQRLKVSRVRRASANIKKRHASNGNDDTTTSGTAKRQPSGSNHRPTGVASRSQSAATTVNVLPPEKQIAAAAAAASAAQLAVDRASDQRLAGLMQEPARKRLYHLNDPSLTTDGQARLRDSIGKELPRGAASNAERSKDSGWSLLRHWHAIVAILLLLALLAGLTFAAWRNTGVDTLVADQTWAVTWRLPGGQTLAGAWRAGYPVVVMQPSKGTVIIRRWVNSRGYAETVVPADWLALNSRPLK